MLNSFKSLTRNLGVNYTLSLRSGKSAECHRFYEALECGCIPVFIDEFDDNTPGNIKWQKA